LSLIGKPVPSGLQGRELSGLFRGDNDGGRDYAFIENVPFPYAPDKGEERCVLSVQWKLILSTKRPPELYEYRVDTREVGNRWDEMKGKPAVTELLNQLEAWAAETRDKLAPRLVKNARAAGPTVKSE
jgi:hypothetical protein